MAQFPTFGISSPSEAYAMAQRRGDIFREASKQIGEAASQGMTALNDTAVKTRVVDALVAKWPELQAKKEDMMQMSSSQLAGQAFVLNSVDGYIKAKKAEVPDQGHSFPSATTFFGADPEHIENIKKMVDGISDSAKGLSEEATSSTQQQAMIGAGTSEQAVGLGKMATPEKPLTKSTISMAEQYSKQAALDAARQRAQGQENSQYLDAINQATQSLKAITDVKAKKTAVKKQKEALHAQWAKFSSQPLTADQQTEYYIKQDEDKKNGTNTAEEYKAQVVADRTRQLQEQDSALTAEDQGYAEEIKSHNQAIELLENQWHFSLDMLKKHTEKQSKGLAPKTESAPSDTTKIGRFNIKVK